MVRAAAPPGILLLVAGTHVRGPGSAEKTQTREQNILPKLGLKTLFRIRLVTGRISGYAENYPNSLTRGVYPKIQAYIYVDVYYSDFIMKN